VYESADSSVDRASGSREIGAWGITSRLQASLERHCRLMCTQQAECREWPLRAVARLPTWLHLMQVRRMEDMTGLTRACVVPPVGALDAEDLTHSMQVCTSLLVWDHPHMHSETTLCAILQMSRLISRAILRCPAATRSGPPSPRSDVQHCR
jgi:hypothetical protein